MLRVPLHKIEPGMVLARPIPMPNDPYRYLLQRDREIPVDLVPRLRKLGILEVWVRCRDLEFLEDIIDEGVSDRQREVYHVVRRNFESIMGGASLGMDMTHFMSTITELFSALKQTRHGNILLDKLDAFDNYLMSHSTNVCYLALLLGMRLERYLLEQRQFKPASEANRLETLGVGCILHDVGKMHIPPEILNKPGKLTEEEFAEIRRHPVYGYEMVRGRVPPTAADVVLNHHQRFDGTGYPVRIDKTSGQPLPALAGERIPIFSRITTVVDVYDAATTRRCYSGAKFPVQVLCEMRTAYRSHFDPKVLEAFFEIIPAFPIGQIVELSDGSEAVVVDFNPRRPERPKVQCLRDPSGARLKDPALNEIDLALYDQLHISAIDGIDVTRHLTSHDQAAGVCGDVVPV